MGCGLHYIFVISLEYMCINMYIMEPEKLGSTSHLDGLNMTGFCGQGLEL